MVAEIREGAIAAQILTGLAIDEVIARYTNATDRTFLTDALGSVFLATNEDMSIISAYGYSAYGETQLYGAGDGNTQQYTARDNDSTGLYYYRARYYDPLSKRFINEDPIGIGGGINVYAYVEGNPITYSDPLGLLPTCITARLSTNTYYSYEKRLTTQWETTVPVPIGTGPEPNFDPPKRGIPGRIPSPGYKIELWVISVEEWTSYLIKKIVNQMRETCTESRTIKDSCGREKPWNYFNEREYEDVEEEKMEWSKWYEIHSRRLPNPYQ